MIRKVLIKMGVKRNRLIQVPISLMLVFTMHSFETMAQISQKEEKSFAILDKAFGRIGEIDNYGIYFEGIAYDLQNPLDIFSLPVYKIYRTGHFYTSGNKFEIEIGRMKALCDGKLMVMINEDVKSMVIDSFRKDNGDFKKQEIELKKIFGEDYSENELSYEGIEKVNKIECHKIKSASKDHTNYVFYWVQVKSGQLLLMAEWQGKAYDVYWIRRIGKSPEGYVYIVNVPKTEVEKLYGYEVFDMRFNMNE